MGRAEVGAVPVADVEQVGEHPHPRPLPPVAEQGAHGHAEMLADDDKSQAAAG